MLHFYGTLNLLTGTEVAQPEPLMNSEATARHLEKLNLKVEPDKALSRTADLSIFLTTLVMNYNYTGQFVDR